MPPDELSPSIDRSRFGGLSPSGLLTIGMAALITLPATYIAFTHWSFVAVLVYVICQLAVMLQGLILLLSCGLKRKCGGLRCYGIYLFLYGTATVAMTLWFVSLAVFGGPAGEDVPLFLAKLWSVAAALFIPPGLYLRRRSNSLSGRTLSSQ